MDLCNFNSLPNPSGKCGNKILQAANNGFSSQNFFSNCTDTNLEFNITASNQDQTSNVNGTLLFLLDNSGLFPSVSKPSSKINLILSYSVIANVNDAEKAKLFLICSLTGVVILVMIVFAAALNCKISRLDKEIKRAKENKI